MPWLASTGPSVHVPMTSTPAKKIGLKFFLAVVSSIFFLFIAAYIIRMDYGDWRPLQDSAILWVNTLVLIASSIAFQLARNAANTDQRQRTIRYLSTAGLLTLVFLSSVTSPLRFFRVHHQLRTAIPSYSKVTTRRPAPARRASTFVSSQTSLAAVRHLP